MLRHMAPEYARESCSDRPWPLRDPDDLRYPALAHHRGTTFGHEGHLDDLGAEAPVVELVARQQVRREVATFAVREVAVHDLVAPLKTSLRGACSMVNLFTGAVLT